MLFDNLLNFHTFRDMHHGWLRQQSLSLYDIVKKRQPSPPASLTPGIIRGNRLYAESPVYLNFLLRGIYRIDNNRSSHIPTVHSQCESKYVSTGAVECFAPISRARIKPSRFEARTIFTFGYWAMYSTNWRFKWAEIQINKEIRETLIRKVLVFEKTCSTFCLWQ